MNALAKEEESDRDEKEEEEGGGDARANGGQKTPYNPANNYSN